MRKRIIICLVSVIGLGLTGCDEKQSKEAVSGVTPTPGAGDFHNEVLAAFDRRASIESVSRMQFEEWEAAVLASMEEVSVAHGIEFDRTEASAEIANLMKVFHALKTATGVDPAQLHASADPHADFMKIVGQMQKWDLVDERTAKSLADFTPDQAAPRAATTADAGLRDVYDIGARSNEFWMERSKTTGPFVVPPIEDMPCKACEYGSTLSDMLGGLVGKVFCRGDLQCRAKYAAAASIMFNMLADYCAEHNCGWDGMLPPVP